ncbi:phosphoribosylaminoimidazolesuccinocarboxamide synthase [Oryzihumus leptocrescens]|uniref:Phosphoribosylaminoimidazole-succinocarboxamide synthase n=1 Tax=Oryzihumus leptocrescens TaxID=297536 RepID=A0A542Z800_9MICO|nr:phosphoribosylaminoimidazolesuccinocarboxamide synthase [Oryzihumus leptocrescens]TQL56473.1 phosphoribosylaminoimidazole-succinocarboxamide synthase [Oryzihumus leptocrescens]
MTSVVPTSPPALPGFAHVYSGKVRELYAPVDPGTGEAREDQLLLVASDRISAYDFILDTEIPDKGAVLTQLSLWWFEQLADILPNHVISTDVPAAVAGRAVLVRRLQMVPVECIGRAYLTGSGLAEYRQTSSVCGVPLPAGLEDGSKLPEPIFTPTTKAPVGEHDQPMTYAQVEAELGADLASRVRDLTTAILARGNAVAAERGILLADTKVEFGLDPAAADEHGRPGIVLADEVLTPDSSRFWPADQWQPGRAQPSYDKQFVRDWLTSPASGWDRHSGEAPPPLPEAIVEQTRTKYVEAYEALTGRRFG